MENNVKFTQIFSSRRYIFTVKALTHNADFIEDYTKLESISD